jgi:thiamine transport system permease protein
VGQGDREQVARQRARGRAAERLALPAAAILTAAILAVVFYYPVATVLVEAVRPDEGFSLRPLVDVLTDPFYVGVLAGALADPGTVPGAVVGWLADPWPLPSLGLFGFTAYQALLSTGLSVVLGLPGAWVLARFEFPGRRALRSLTIVPFVLPAVMVAAGFVALYSTRGVLAGLGVADLVPIRLFTLEIIVVAHAFYNAPLVTRLVTAAWETVDTRTVETARSLGASPFRAFRDVVAPQLLPALATAALLTFVFTFMSFPIVLALGGLRLATVEVWLYARIQQLDLAEAAALAIVETAVSLLLTYLYLRYEARQATDATPNPLPRTPLGRIDDARGALLRAGITTYGLLVVLVFVGPLVSMVLVSLGYPEGWTLRNYEFLAARQTDARTRPLTAVRNSLLFAAGTLALALPMGVTVSVVTTRKWAGRRLADALLMAPLAVSGVVLGLGLLQGLVFGVDLFGTRVTVTGPVAVVAAHAVAAYPFVVRNVTPMLERVDTRIVESARSLGATRTRALLDVELPLVVPGLLAGAAFTAAISIGEFDSTVILSTMTDTYTMPVALERYLGDRSVGPDLGPASAMGVVLLLVTAASFVVIDRVGDRGGGGW